VQEVLLCCLFSTLMLAIAACTSRAVKEEPMPTSATLAARGIECHKERATGSLVAATVCTSAAERARQVDEAQQTKDWMEKAKGGPCTPNVPC
jgi:hypothetical protein